MSRALVFVGAGLAAYETAAAWYEAYGVKTVCLTPVSSVFTKHSSFLDEYLVPDLSDETVLLSKLQSLATTTKTDRMRPLLMTASDYFAGLLIRQANFLASLYDLTLPGQSTEDVWQDRSRLNAWLNEYGLTTPESTCLPQAECSSDNAAITYPVIVKLRDKTAYTALNPESKTNTMCALDGPALDRIAGRISKSDYDGDLVVESYIASDPSTVFLVSACVDHACLIRFLAVGQVLLADPTPQRYGIPLVISHASSDMISLLTNQVETFLQASRYKGCITLEFRCDLKDGCLKVVSARPHLGETAGFLLALHAGKSRKTDFNQISSLMHQVFSDCGPSRSRDSTQGDSVQGCLYSYDASFLWMSIKPRLAIKYLKNTGPGRLVSTMLSEGQVVIANNRKEDHSLMRRRYLWQHAYFQKKRLQRYNHL